MKVDIYIKFTCWYLVSNSKSILKETFTQRWNEINKKVIFKGQYLKYTPFHVKLVELTICKHIIYFPTLLFKCVYQDPILLVPFWMVLLEGSTFVLFFVFLYWWEVHWFLSNWWNEQTSSLVLIIWFTYVIINEQVLS
jgi:hypothetical protein